MSINIEKYNIDLGHDKVIFRYYLKKNQQNHNQ